MTKESNPKAREKELVVQELKGELLLYDLNTNKAFCLNETSAAIWNLCDGKSSVSEIGGKLSKQLKQPVPDEMVYLALDQFKRDDLLSESDEMEIDFKGLSRREVIRKAGLASMVALPVISSLVAPTAAMAQSGGGPTNLALLATCSASSQCASGNCFSNTRCCAPSSVGIVGTAPTASLIGDCATVTPAQLNDECGEFSSLVCCSGTVPTSDGTCTDIGGFVQAGCRCPQ